MEKQLRSQLYLCAGMMITLFVAPLSALAVQATFSGTLIGNSPCMINNNDPIEVDFGDVLIRDVQGQEGSEYSRDVPYTIDCENANTSDAMNLRISGIPTSWDGYLLRTSKANLGLQFYVDGLTYELNDDYSFSYGDEPTITVAPEGSNSLSDNDDGDFYATASLTVEYQ
ncbi:putative fimbrial-like protein YfcQ [Providencia alcalifaciens]|nr:putative fimbrial-like protein YfcQ [Providencia alcalifaciens]